MRIEYNRVGAERKALVNAISEIIGVKAKYLFTPTCAYEIDYFTVTRDGALEFDDMADCEEVENLLLRLEQKGFVVPCKQENETKELLSQESKRTPHKENVGLTVAIPKDKVNVTNVAKLLGTKGFLIKKALGVNDLPIEEKKDKVLFPWFETLPNENTVKAYTDFISALCNMSKVQKRINTTEKKVQNEKYAFRCFLLRLGFIGDEYKEDRKILLANLSGSSAFKTKENCCNENSK